jgi:hypothetical protein
MVESAKGEREAMLAKAAQLDDARHALDSLKLKVTELSEVRHGALVAPCWGLSKMLRETHACLHTAAAFRQMLHGTQAEAQQPTPCKFTECRVAHRSIH